MNKEKVALVLLGVIGVLAVVGLVLMFAQQNYGAGLGVYSNPAKYNDPYPNWNKRGPPLNVEYPTPQQGWDVFKQQTTDWNNYGVAKRDPGQGYATDVPSAATGCGRGGELVSVQQKGYLEMAGYRCEDTVGMKAGWCCYLGADTKYRSDRFY